MENPLFGSFNRERTMLVFRQRSLEVQAAYLAMIGGTLMVLFGLAKGFGLVPFGRVPASWFLIFGLAFGAAGLWAFLLFRFIKFDLRKRLYVERAGSGLTFSQRKGSLDEVRCLELSRYHGLLPGAVGQRSSSWGTAMPNQSVPAPVGTLLTLRLWWHDPRRPPVVVEHLVVGTAYGYQDQRTMHFLGLAQAYAQALRIPLTGSI
jgi:hypothetical protein